MTLVHGGDKRQQPAAAMKETEATEDRMDKADDRMSTDTFTGCPSDEFATSCRPEGTTISKESSDDCCSEANIDEKSNKDNAVTSHDAPGSREFELSSVMEVSSDEEEKEEEGMAGSTCSSFPDILSDCATCSRSEAEEKFAKQSSVRNRTESVVETVPSDHSEKKVPSSGPCSVTESYDDDTDDSIYQAIKNVSSLSTRMIDPEVTIESPDTTDLKCYRPGIRDFAKLLQHSKCLSEVSAEQLERVKLMHDRFASEISFTFNYCVLLLVSSVLAGLGLVSNSSTTVIASMLVSPILGPVNGIAYGFTIRDYRMVKRAIRNEVGSLLFCVASGVIIGLVTGPTKLSDTWPTQEMVVRGTWKNFLVGIPVAFFSGLAVGVSLLDDHTSSMVGAAISASLLPPAVNAGILWVAWFYVEKEVVDPTLLDIVGEVLARFSIKVTAQDDDEEMEKMDFRHAGAISLALTLVNIVLVSLASMIMFRMKEVCLTEDESACVPKGC